MKTTQDMIDEAMENGAALVLVGNNEWIKTCDDGGWYHLTLFGEFQIDRAQALKLWDAYRS